MKQYEMIEKMSIWFSLICSHSCSVCWIINRNKWTSLSMYDANITGKSHFNFILDVSAYAMFLVSAGLLSC